MGSARRSGAVGVLCVLMAAAVFAQEAAPELRAVRADVAPKMDGLLDDVAWSGQPVGSENWVSYNPLRGEPAAMRTRVWVAYDNDAIYFAFRCFDPEPGRIRTTITRRDNVWNDDWIGVSLDSSRAGQVAYHMFVNPSGIQMDALQTSSGEDTAPDWQWQTAGNVDAEGYTVEMRVPLQSLRFRSGDNVRMGVLFFRRNSRTGLSWSWPEMPPGKWVFESHVPLVFDHLQQPLLLEVIPSATVSGSQARPRGAGWTRTRSQADLGASVKYGVSSTVTLDATINPDFSQVESDAFQVEVNERFPIFFSEKRPFFMEGLGIFNIAGTGGDSTMRTAVHTRKIVDPSAGGKLTGTSGRQTYGTLIAADESPLGDPQRFFAIGRVQRNYGNAQYLGALVTDTEHRGSHNRVAVGDFALRTNDRFKYSGALMYSQSQDLAGADADGIGAHLDYNYNTRRLGLSGHLEHFDRGFQMATAFMNRVGLTRTWQYGEIQFYPDATRYGWLKRVAPFYWGTYGKDRVQNGTEPYLLSGIRFNFTRQGNLRLDMARGRESFSGHRFETGRLHADGNVQLLRWLSLSGYLETGPGIFYDPANPVAGTNTKRRLRVILQPNARLTYDGDYTFVKFDQNGGPRLVNVHVANLRNTYQFTSRFFVRGIVQYDSSQHRILGDFLASYELVPGTVVHAGYGTLLESDDVRPYKATQRALFFKASYLTRF